MSYVNKNTALRNLANSDKLFKKFQNNFLNRYKNGIEELTNLVAENDVNGVYDYINSIKSYALNIGSEALDNDSNIVLEEIKRNGKIPSLEVFIETFRYVYQELERIE